MSIVVTLALDGTGLNRPNGDTARNGNDLDGIWAHVAEMLRLWRVRLQTMINLMIHMEHTLM